MKPMIAAVGLLVSHSLSLAQGTVNFSNFPPFGGTRLITYDASVPGKNSAPVEVGSLNVALYWAPLGSTESQLVQIGSIGIIAPIPGIFASGTRKTGTATPEGAPALFQVRAWSVGFNSYEAALASGGSSVLAGKSLLFQNDTANFTRPPPLPPATLNMPGFTVAPIPEPGTFVIGILGAAALFLFRRK